MNIEQVAAQLDKLAQAEQQLSSNRIVTANNQKQQIQIQPAFLALAVINLHIRMRNVEMHLGLVEKVVEEPPAGEGKVN